MMTRRILAIFSVLMVVPGLSWAAAVGEKAPDFSAKDSRGKTVKLEDLSGKYVVLEWHNQGCPYVRKHYETGNMQKLQKEWTGKGVEWFTVISSAPGKQGNVTPTEENEYLAKTHAAPTAVLMDEKGELAKLYGAKTTPHMFVIDPKGVLIYNGAIDDRSTTDKEDVKGAKNYISAALTESMAGKPVKTSSTRPYGCSVKY